MCFESKDAANILGVKNKGRENSVFDHKQKRDGWIIFSSRLQATRSEYTLSIGTISNDVSVDIHQGLISGNSC